MPRRRTSRGNSANKSTSNSRSNKGEKKRSSGNTQPPERPRPKEHQAPPRHPRPMGMPSSKDNVVHSAPGVDRRKLLIRNMPGNKLREVHSHIEEVLHVKVQKIRWDPLFPDIALVSLESDMERDITECRVELYQRPLNSMCLEVDSVGVTRGVLLRELHPSTADVDIQNQLSKDVTWRMALYVDINMAVVLFTSRKDADAALERLRKNFKHAELFHDSFHNEEIKARLQMYPTPRILSHMHKAKPAPSKKKEPKKSSWNPLSKVNLTGKQDLPPSRSDSDCIAGEEVGRPYGVEDENYAWRRSSVDEGSTVDPIDVNRNKAGLSQSFVASSGGKSAAVQRSMSYPGEEGGRGKLEEGGTGSNRNMERSGEGGERGKCSREEAGRGAGADEGKRAAGPRAHGNAGDADSDLARSSNPSRKAINSPTRSRRAPQSDFECPESTKKDKTKDEREDSAKNKAPDDESEMSDLSRKMGSKLKIKESGRPLSPQPDYDEPSEGSSQEAAEEEEDHDHGNDDEYHDAEDDHGLTAREDEVLFHKNEPWRLIPPEIDSSDQELETKRTDASNFIFSDEEDPDDVVEVMEVSGAAVKLLSESKYFQHIVTCRINFNTQKGIVVLEGPADAVTAAKFELEDTINHRIVTEKFRVNSAAKQLLDTYMGREWIAQHVGGDYRSSRVVTDVSEDGVFSCCSFEKFQAQRVAQTLEQGIFENYLTLPKVQSEEWQEKWKAAVKSTEENPLLKVAAEKENPSLITVAGFGKDDVEVVCIQLQHLIEKAAEVEPPPPSPETSHSNPDSSSEHGSRGKETLI